MSNALVGTRVKYNDDGGMGTIIAILMDDYPFVIQWDDGEPVDAFKANQLSLIG